MTSKNTDKEKIKLIIFDVGGVVIRYDEKYYMDYLNKKTGINVNRLKKAFYDPIVQMEYGKTRLKEFESEMVRRLKIGRSKLGWHRAFLLLASKNEEVADVMKTLKETYKIALLSNISRSRFIAARKMIDKRLYDRFFVSAYLHMRKPDPKIYNYVLDKMHVRPSEAIFIDNLEENVQGARRVGIKAIRFRGAGKLKYDLRRFGVLR